MNIKDIYNLALKIGIKSDFRGEKKVRKILQKRREKFNRLSKKEKEEFDKEGLTNPYSDTRILNIAEDKKVKKILVGIDIAPAELLLTKEIGGVDMVLSHHPIGEALAGLSEVMDLQIDVLAQYGVPINIAQGLLRERISEVSRSTSPQNHQRTIDTAKLLNINLMCCHSVCDNLAAHFLNKLLRKKQPERVGEILDVLKEIPEYKIATKQKAGPKVFVGDKENYCGKIILVEMAGGTEGSPKMYGRMSQAGIGTVIGMHMSEVHVKEAKKHLINVVIAGHIASDSLGVNIFLDELEKKGIKIIPCAGLIRFSRTKK